MKYLSNFFFENGILVAKNNNGNGVVFDQKKGAVIRKIKLPNGFLGSIKVNHLSPTLIDNDKVLYPLDQQLILLNYEDLLSYSSFD